MFCLKQSNKLIWSQRAAIDPRIRLPLVYNSACPLGPVCSWSEHGDHSKCTLCINSKSIQSKAANWSSHQRMMLSEQCPWKTGSSSNAAVRFFSPGPLPSPPAMSLWWLVVHGKEYPHNLWESAHLEECIWFVVRKLPFSKL